MELHDLDPWSRGPFELIRHAQGHLEVAGDIDRRIALIGFDNAIEVCIDVFLNLHPKLRNGFEVTKERKSTALTNYHTKIEFFEEYRKSLSVTSNPSIESIIWYHQLRNELYHSGNGMVPEIHVIEGARDASLAVFEVLFGKKVSSLLGLINETTDFVSATFPIQGNDQMEFLRTFIEFEQRLKSYFTSIDKHLITRSPIVMWREFAKVKNFQDNVIESMNEVFAARNLIVHSGNTESDLSKLQLTLTDVTKQLP